MRRTALIVSALGALALALAGAAFASGHGHKRHGQNSQAINTYKHTLKFTTKAAGTKRKPVPIGFTQNIVAKGTNGNRTAVLLDLKTKIHGIVANNGNKAFPTCSLNQIANSKKHDSSCPKGALVASGYITAVLGPENDFGPGGAATSSSCDPLLRVWNGGKGKLTFFFVDTPSHQCLGGALKTGSTPPYPATVKQEGENLVINVPIPSSISFPLGPGSLAGSLETEHLVWRKATVKAHGKKIPLFASIGCKGKKRPYAETFKATLPSPSGGKGTTQTKTLSGKAPC